jgi:hypothetical protein
MPKPPPDMLATGDRVYYARLGKGTAGTVTRVGFNGYAVHWDLGAGDDETYQHSDLVLIPEE